MFRKLLRSLIAPDYSCSQSSTPLCRQLSPECSCCRVQGFSCWVTCQSAKLASSSHLQQYGDLDRALLTTTWMTNLLSSLKVTFPFVLHTLSHVRCTREVVWHSAQSGSICYLCPVISITQLRSPQSRCHPSPRSWISFCWHHLLLKFLSIILKKLFTSYHIKAEFWVLNEVNGNISFY